MKDEEWRVEMADTLLGKIDLERFKQELPAMIESCYAPCHVIRWKMPDGLHISIMIVPSKRNIKVLLREDEPDEHYKAELRIVEDEV